jgi:hypothetical protein
MIALKDLLHHVYLGLNDSIDQYPELVEYNVIVISLQNISNFYLGRQEVFG